MKLVVLFRAHSSGSRSIDCAECADTCLYMLNFTAPLKGWLHCPEPLPTGCHLFGQPLHLFILFTHKFKKSIHPFSTTCPLQGLVGWGWWIVAYPSPTLSRARDRVHPGESASLSQGQHTKTNSHSHWGQFGSANSSVHACLDDGRKPEYLERKFFCILYCIFSFFLFLNVFYCCAFYSVTVFLHPALEHHC